ncbi:MAG: hypothetical protein ACOY15_00060 [Pseudomonadota bacterium]
MIYIVGTNHELQHTAAPSRAAPRDTENAREELKSYMRQLANEIKPVIMAEEFSQNVLTFKNCNSNVKDVADELGIKHCFCDPDVQERVILGLPAHGTEHCDPSDRSRFNALREEYWVKRLSDVLDQTVLFVCGADHVASFSRLLRGKGIATKVQEEYFGRDIYCR